MRELCEECGEPIDVDDDEATEAYCGYCTRQLRAEESYDERQRNRWQG